MPNRRQLNAQINALKETYAKALKTYKEHTDLKTGTFFKSYKLKPRQRQARILAVSLSDDMSTSTADVDTTYDQIFKSFYSNAKLKGQVPEGYSHLFENDILGDKGPKQAQELLFIAYLIKKLSLISYDHSDLAKDQWERLGDDEFFFDPATNNTTQAYDDANLSDTGVKAITNLVNELQQYSELPTIQDSRMLDKLKQQLLTYTEPSSSLAAR